MRSLCLLVALLAQTVVAQKALITFQAARNEKLAVYFSKLPAHVYAAHTYFETTFPFTAEATPNAFTNGAEFCAIDMK